MWIFNNTDRSKIIICLNLTRFIISKRSTNNLSDEQKNKWRDKFNANNQIKINKSLNLNKWLKDLTKKQKDTVKQLVGITKQKLDYIDIRLQISMIRYLEGCIMRLYL